MTHEDYEIYRKNYFVDPAPEPRFSMTRIGGMSLSIEDYEAGVAFYTQVLGPPAYVEGDDTHGWPIGTSWLTLFRAQKGRVDNVELQIEVASTDEVDRMIAALIEAGATAGLAPQDVLCYEPIRMGYVTDPFGTCLSVTAKR